MTHFEDLSAYTYTEVDDIHLGEAWPEFRPRYERVNVGWLDAPHAFEVGPTPDWFAAALLDILAGPDINRMRGYHCCSFCRGDYASSMLSVDHPTGKIVLGHSEFRVPAKPGVMFAGPSLIWHYVTSHGYRPPAAFIEAVRTYDPGWLTLPSPWIPDDPENDRR